jgi:hypothetical protein
MSGKPATQEISPFSQKFHKNDFVQAELSEEKICEVCQKPFAVTKYQKMKRLCRVCQKAKNNTASTVYGQKRRAREKLNKKAD